MTWDEIWAYTGSLRVEQAARQDPEVRQMGEQLQQMMDEYESLLARLPEQEKDLIVEAANLMLDIEYRKTQLAYFMSPWPSFPSNWPKISDEK